MFVSRARLSSMVVCCGGGLLLSLAPASASEHTPERLKERLLHRSAELSNTGATRPWEQWLPAIKLHQSRDWREVLSLEFQPEASLTVDLAYRQGLAWAATYQPRPAVTFTLGYQPGDIWRAQVQLAF